MNKPRLFWDSSALVSAVVSPSRNSPARQLLRLGEAGVVDMRLSRQVLREVELILRKRHTALLPRLAVMLNQGNFAVTLDPDDDTISRCMAMTGYRPDARVLAAAVECDADLFITHDTKHFLQNPLIGPPDTRLRVVTPYQCLDWCREHLRARD